MTARPQSTEAVTYYFTYIDKVPDGEILNILTAQLDETLGWCSAISEERSLHRYAEGKWTIREVLSHLNDAERLFAFRAFWFARGLEPDLPSFEQDIAAAHFDANRISWAAHVEEFRRIRLASISLFENLKPEDWDRGGKASGNYFSVRALAYITAGHVEHHRRLLKERYGAAA